MVKGRHSWQYPDAEIAKLEDPKVKAFFVVNPSNPGSFAMRQETLSKHRRPWCATSAPIC